jgi:predicted RNA binding protein with dsRBD fold (UPF0201 family)
MTEQENKVDALVLEIFDFIKAKENEDVNMILTALTIVVSTIAVETMVEEEKAVYTFRKLYRKAESRMKSYLKRNIQ